MTNRCISILLSCVMILLCNTGDVDAKKNKRKKKKQQNVTKIISSKEFTKALKNIAKDERLPVASSTLVEKGRGENYYSVEKLLDKDRETFWAEGAKKWGENEWVAFCLPENTTFVEITPGAGKEQFENFNRPRLVYLDAYLVKLKHEQGEYKPNFKWIGRTEFIFKDKPTPLRKKLSVKLPELVISERNMYVGVIILRGYYKGQFDDTAISEINTSTIWADE